MSGHSKWATTKHQKAIVDAKRSKTFTKIQKEIAVAVKTGDPNPDFNPRLRNAIILAKSENMPKDKIEAAIKRASSGTEGENYEEIRYEGQTKRKTDVRQMQNHQKKRQSYGYLLQVS